MKAKRRLNFSIPIWWPDLPSAERFRAWMPSRGNVLFTLFALCLFGWAQAVGAVPNLSPQSPDTASTGTVAYQGRLANPAGQPLTGTYGMIFRLYANPSGGSPLWTEQWTGSNSVQVSDGLFNVMLGSISPIPENVVTENSSLWLGITVGSDDEMAPRVQLGSVPFAVQSLTLPDDSVTTAKIVDGAVTADKLAPGALSSVRAGTGTWTGVFGQNPAAGTWYRDVSVSFSSAFTTTPSVVISVNSVNPDSWSKVKDVTPNGFTATQIGLVNLGSAAIQFNWMAMVP